MNKTNFLKQKIFAFIFALNFSANKIEIIHNVCNTLLYSFILVLIFNIARINEYRSVF